MHEDCTCGLAGTAFLAARRRFLPLVGACSGASTALRFLLTRPRRPSALADAGLSASASACHPKTCSPSTSDTNSMCMQVGAQKMSPSAIHVSYCFGCPHRTSRSTWQQQPPGVVHAKFLTWHSVWVTCEWVVVLYKLQQQLLHRQLSFSAWLQACLAGFAGQNMAQLSDAR